MFGFQYAGVNSLSFGVALEQPGIHISPLPPTVERRIHIAGQAGSWNYGATFGDLPITLDCFLVQPDRTTMQSYVNALGVLLDPRLGERQLVLPDRTGYYMAAYSGSIDFAPILAVVHFKLPFLCSDPFIHT
jgi:hypothetical protein